MPLGFAVLAWPGARPGWGLGLLAAAKSWIVGWYLLNGEATIVLANVAAAVGCWLWLAAEGTAARPVPDEASRPA